MSRQPSFHQMEVLVDFLEKNKQVALGYSRTPQGRATMRARWESVANQLNAVGTCTKDWKGWNKYWTDKKCHVKKKAAEQHAALRRTGGGDGDENIHLTFTPIEERMLNLLGESFGIGDREYRVDPFPSELQLTESPPLSPLRPLRVQAQVHYDADFEEIRAITPSPPPLQPPRNAGSTCSSDRIFSFPPSSPYTQAPQGNSVSSAMALPLTPRVETSENTPPENMLPPRSPRISQRLVRARSMVMTEREWLRNMEEKKLVVEQEKVRHLEEMKNILREIADHMRRY